MTRSTVTFLFIGFLLLAIYFFQREEPSSSLIRTRLLMGTVVEIRVEEEDAGRFEESVTAAFAEMTAIEELMSPHLPESEVSRISKSTAPVILSPETLEVLHLADEIMAKSAGAFDVNLGRLISLWGFADGEPNLPTRADIADALADAGPDSLKISNGTVIKNSAQLAVDFGGVAKGYAIDRAIAILADAGIKHASVNAGGDMRLLGDRFGTPWRIGIQHPRKSDELLARLRLANTAVVTSGDYERYFEKDGIRYHHILDPRTGYPARLCQSVTVVAGQAALADAVATAVFVLGPGPGMELLLSMEKVEGIIVAADGSVDATPGLREVVEWQ